MREERAVAYTLQLCINVTSEWMARQTLFHAFCFKQSPRKPKNVTFNNKKQICAIFICFIMIQTNTWSRNVQKMILVWSNSNSLTWPNSNTRVSELWATISTLTCDELVPTLNMRQWMSVSSHSWFNQSEVGDERCWYSEKGPNDHYRSQQMMENPAVRDARCGWNLHD